VGFLTGSLALLLSRLGIGGADEEVFFVEGGQLELLGQRYGLAGADGFAGTAEYASVQPELRLLLRLGRLGLHHSDGGGWAIPCAETATCTLSNVVGYLAPQPLRPDRRLEGIADSDSLPF